MYYIVRNSYIKSFLIAKKNVHKPIHIFHKLVKCPELVEGLPIQNAFRTINWGIIKQELEPFIEFMNQQGLLAHNY